MVHTLNAAVFSVECTPRPRPRLIIFAAMAILLSVPFVGHALELIGEAPFPEADSSDWAPEEFSPPDPPGGIPFLRPQLAERIFKLPGGAKVFLSSDWRHAAFVKQTRDARHLTVIRLGTGERVLSLSGALTVQLMKGRLVALEQTDADLRVWDLAKGLVLKVLPIKKSEYRAISPDARLVAWSARTGRSSLRGQLKVIDAATKEEVTVLKEKVRGIWFSPDGSSFLIKGNIPYDFRVVDTKTWEVRPKWSSVRTGGNKYSIPSPDLRYVITFKDGTLRIVDAVTGDKVRELEGSCSDGSRVWDGDGKRIAALCKDGLNLRVWDATTGRLAEAWNEPGAMSLHGFSPDGRKLALSLTTKELVFRTIMPIGEIQWNQGPRGALQGVAFHPSGRFLATGGAKRVPLLWDIEGGRVAREFETVPRVQEQDDQDGGAVLTTAFSPDGSLLASAGDDRVVRLWDVESGSLVSQLEGHGGAVRRLAFSPNGDRLLSAGEFRVIEWNVADRTRLRVLLQSDNDNESFGEVFFSPNKRQFVVALGRDYLRLWSEATGEHIHDLGFELPSNPRRQGAAFSPDGLELAMHDSRGGLRFWDVRSEELLPTILHHPSTVNVVAYSPDGSTITTSAGSTIYLWERATGLLVHTLEAAWAQQITDLVFSSNGRRLAASVLERYRGRSSLCVWELSTGAEVRKFPDLPVEPRLITFSPDGRLLASLDWLGLVVLWDARTHRPLLRFSTSGWGMVHVAFSPDGSLLAGLGNVPARAGKNAPTDPTIYVWNTVTGQMQWSVPLAPGQKIDWLAFTADGQELLAFGKQMVRIDVVSHEFRFVSRLRAECVAAPDRKTLYLASRPKGQLTLVMAGLDGQAAVEKRLEQDAFGSIHAPWYCHGKSFSISPTPRARAAGSWQSSFRVVDLRKAEEVARMPAAKYTTSALSPSGQLLAVGRRDGAIEIFDVETGLDVVTLQASGAGTWMSWTSDRLWRYDPDDVLMGRAGGIETFRPLNSLATTNLE